MADLSRLSDEQLQVYREMLAQRQGSAVPGAPGGTPPEPPKPDASKTIHYVGAGGQNIEHPAAAPEPLDADVQQFSKNHPIIHGLAKSIYSDAAPMPMAMNLPGSGASLLSRGAGMLRGMFTDPAARDAAIKMLPRGEKVLDWKNLVKGNIPSGESQTFVNPDSVTARPAPLWAAAPDPKPPELPDLSPIRGQLPSGRIPGKPAFDTSTGDMLSKQPGGQFTGLVNPKPAPPALVAPSAPRSVDSMISDVRGQLHAQHPELKALDWGGEESAPSPGINIVKPSPGLINNPRALSIARKLAQQVTPQ